MVTTDSHMNVFITERRKWHEDCLYDIDVDECMAVYEQSAWKACMSALDTGVHECSWYF